jgi:choline-sulfatase
LTRKDFLRAAALAPSLAPAAQRAIPAASRPNVLLIMADQHRPEYMTAAGSSLVPTPNIDRIAARGVRFTHAVCPYPVCAASRASLLSGLYPHTHGVINNTDLLDWRTRTVAHHFADAGYHTGLIGKMHFNDGHTHGFHYFLGFNDWFMYLGPKVQAYANEIANHAIGPQFFATVNDDGSGLPELPGVWGGKLPWAGHVERIGFASEIEPDDQFDAFVARESVRFLERHGKTEPFFLVASFLKPHPPLHPPRPWDARYPVDTIALPPVGDVTQYPKRVQNRIDSFQRLGSQRLREHRAGYLGNLAYVDTCVGEVYRSLERLALLENTIVVYTSDHGEMDGDHGLYQKFCLFDPSVGVPLIVSYPGKLPEGRISHELVEYMSIYPTLAELTGTDAPRGIDAGSFARLARNPDAKGPEAVFSEFNLKAQTDCYMVRTRRYKYIYNRGDIAELYDLEADPRENVNRQADSSLARVRSQLHDRLMAWHKVV